MKKLILAVLLATTGVVVAQTTYYSKHTGYINELSTWGTNPDGSGASPTSFGHTYDVFYLVNNPKPSLNANLTLAGDYQQFYIGDGNNPCRFIVPSEFTITAHSNVFLMVAQRATFTIGGQLNIGEGTIVTTENSFVEFVGASPQAIPGAMYENLSVSGGLKVATGPVYVSEKFTMSSSINLNGYGLTIGRNAKQLGSLEWSAGTLFGGSVARWFDAATNSEDDGLLPIGTATAHRPVAIEYTKPPSVAHIISATFNTATPGSNGLPLKDATTEPTVLVNKVGRNGYWSLESRPVAGGTYTGTFTAALFDGVKSFADLRLVQRDNSTSPWALHGIAEVTTGSNAAPMLKRTGMTSFGDFGTGGDSVINALPVKLIILSVTEEKQEAVLAWKTAQEQNSHHFEIMRSTDNVLWESIAKVKAAGNSNALQEYIHRDDIKELVAQRTKTIYYQLRQVDLDGSLAYSDVITLSPKLAQTTITLYPLPISSLLAAVSSAGEVISEITLMDMAGKEVVKSNSAVVDAAHIAQGVYLAKVVTEQQVYYQKITK